MKAMKKYIAEFTNINGAYEENLDGYFVVPFEFVISQALWFFAYCHDEYIKKPGISPIEQGKRIKQQI